MVSKFDLEKPRVALLMQRLGLIVDEYEDPNANARGDESGADVVVTCNGRRICIQVTDLDTGEELGQARKVEKRLQRDATGMKPLA
jgi:hypothetical protein